MRRWLEIGDALSPSERGEAALRRQEMGAWWRTQLRELDAVLIPTSPYPAPRADAATVEIRPGEVVEVEEIGPGWLTSSINLAGLPALTVPAGRSAEGLPFGVTLVGRDGEEEVLLAMAARWERAAGHVLRRPPLPTEPMADRSPPRGA